MKYAIDNNCQKSAVIIWFLNCGYGLISNFKKQNYITTFFTLVFNGFSTVYQQIFTDGKQ